MENLSLYERILWKLLGNAMKRRGFNYIGGISGKDCPGITGIIISSIPIDEYRAPNDNSE